MNKAVFFKRLEEIRESIFHGNVSEGITLLMGWLPELKEADERMEVLLDMIMLSLVCNDLEEAGQNWGEVQKLPIEETPVRLKGYQAMFLVLSGKRKRGLNLFEECILEKPDSYELYMLRGMAYIQTNQFEHAQADLERANTLSPNNLVAMSLLGDVCAEVGERDRAIALHETVLERCPDYKRSLMSLGVLYYDMNRMDESFMLFQCLAAYDPANWFAWTCLGDILSMQRGQSFQALPYYAASIVMTCDSSSTYLGLARGLFLLGKYANGVRVLKQFEHNGGHWTSDERRLVRFMTLIADVIEHPDMVRTDEFISVFRSLKDLCDEYTAMLFQVLSASCAFRNTDSTQRIFIAHITVFWLIAEFIKASKTRPICLEEALLLGVIAHQLIWDGFRYEAASILSMFHTFDDPRIYDMISYLWNELYEQSQTGRATGSYFEGLHKEFVRMPDGEVLINSMLTGQFRGIPDNPLWRARMSARILGEANSGLINDLTHFSYDRVLASFAADCSEDPATAGIGWQLCAHYGDSDFDNYRESLCANLSESGKKTVDNLLSIYRGAAKTVSAPARPNSAEMLNVKYENDTKPVIDGMFWAANDNIVRETTADAFEALAGHEPYPFAMDGSAFQRLMPRFDCEVGYLDDKGLRRAFESIVYRTLFCASRSLFSQNVCVDNAQLAQYTDRVIEIWHALCGDSRLVKSLLADDDRMFQSVIDIVYRGCTSYHIIQDAIKAGVFPDEGVMLPQSDIRLRRSMMYRIPSVCPYPRSASIYATAVSGQLLGWQDIAEQFFNHAVDIIENYISTHQNQVLSLFFDKSTEHGFTFRPFESFSSPKKTVDFHARKKTEKHKLMRHPHVIGRMRASNSDKESRHFISVSQGSVSRSRLILPANTDVIHTTKDLAHSIRQAHALYLQKMKSRTIDHDAFNEGFFLHPFMEQFMEWAKSMATRLFPELQQIELGARCSQIDADQLLWKINELLGKYPFLSRLYLIQAKIYARQNAEDKVFQTLQNGYVWESRLYQGVGWKPVHPGKDGQESMLEPVDSGMEFEEPQPLIWRERYVFWQRDEIMAHYINKTERFGMRERERNLIPCFVQRIVNGDKGGCYEFYQLFKQFIQRCAALREVFVSAINTAGVYSLRDYLVHVITNLVAPMYFPLRRQLAEFLFQLYPQESTGPVARFYTDNIQPSNALPKAAYAYFADIAPNDDSDRMQAASSLSSLMCDLTCMEDALVYAQESVKYKNPPAQAYLTMGCALIELQRFEEAVEALKKGRDLDPMLDRFYYNLSLACVELNRLDEAEQYAKSGIALAKYTVDLNLQLLRVYVRKGKFIDALPLVRAIADFDPDMLINAMQYAEFDGFREMLPVKTILEECMYNKPVLE